MGIFIGYVIGGLIFGAALLLLFRHGDAAVPSAVRERLPGTGGEVGPRALLEVFGHAIDRLFGTDAFSLRFIFAALILSLCAFALFFATYLMKIPDFAGSLMEDAYQRSAVGRQIFFMFIPANAVISYLSLAYCRDVMLQMEHADSTARLWLLLIKDVAMKLVIVAFGMALVYLVLAGRGSFSGSSRAALVAVPEVLWGAMRFGNLNCVYVYSSLVTSVWLWAWLLSGKVAAGRHLPRAFLHEEHPVRALALQAAVIAALLYWAVVIVT